MKRVLSLFLAALLLLGVLASCDTQTPGPETSDPSQSSEPVPSNTPQSSDHTQTLDPEDTSKTTTTKEKEIVQPEIEKSNAVMVNQLGYLTNGQKLAYVTGGGKTFDVVDATNGAIVYSGKIQKGGYEETSGDDVHFIDFSDFKTPGTYYLWVNQEIFSYTFKIGDDVYNQFVKDLVKTVFYQRCGYKLPDGYTDPYAHDVCHTNNGFYLMSEKFSKGINVDFGRDLSGGWHDAGDFSVQGVSNSLTASLLMYAYLLYPEYTSYDDSGIPESGNGVPDILDEAKWGIQWLMKMQNADGSVQRRIEVWGQPPITTRADLDTGERYVMNVSRSDTANMAATCALAARVYKDIDPEFSSTCLEASKRAYEWIMANPDFEYQFAGNYYGQTTEFYGESENDELLWAKAELYATTGDAKYLENTLELSYSENLTGIGYHDRGGMAILSLITNGEEGWDIDAAYNIKLATKKQAKEFSRTAKDNKWNIIANSDPSWQWHYNLNSHFAKAAMTMIFAQHVDSKLDYSAQIAGPINFVFGDNPLNFCFAYGYGTYSVKNLHHRNCVLGNMFPGVVAPGPGAFKSVSTTHKDLDSYLPAETPILKCYYDKQEYYRFNEWTVDQTTWHLINVLDMIANANGR